MAAICAPHLCVQTAAVSAWAATLSDAVKGWLVFSSHPGKGLS